MSDTRQIKKIYSLSPLQEGFLFHSIVDQDSEAYFEQTTFSLEGNLDIGLFEASYKNLVSRHDIFRTNFIYQRIQKPQQIVLAKRDADIFFKDISYMDESTAEVFVNDFKKSDRKRGFNLSADVLIRVSVLKTGRQQYKIIWSFHHIIMDGWCISLVVREFFQNYMALLHNIPFNPKTVYPYSSYIEWLERQDKEAAAAYWKQYLEGYGKQAKLIKEEEVRKSSEQKTEEMYICLSETLTGGLERIAKSYGVTLNNVFQALWGIMLQKRNATDDVVFGAVVSGRPSEIPGVETMIGLFINTIPVRIKRERSDTFCSLIKKVQENAVLSGKYDFLSLATVQSLTSLKQNLIDHVMAFENYPVDTEVGENDEGLEIGFRVTGVETFEQGNYSFGIAVRPGKELRIRVIYNSLSYDRESIEKIGEHLREIAEKAVENPLLRVDDIDILGDYSSRMIASNVTEDDGDFNF